MLADLRAWPLRRRMITAVVAVIAFAVIVAVSGLAAPLLAPVPTPTGSPVAVWLSLAAAAVASVLAGLVVASYVGTPIGADATLCDTRWPVLGLVATSLATDVRSAEPLLTGVVRPVVALAAVALLVWALRERLASERRATASALGDAGSADGEVCTTCRPLFTRAAPLDHDHGLGLDLDLDVSPSPAPNRAGTSPDDGRHGAPAPVSRPARHAGRRPAAGV